jgi:hypothetical protein
MPSSARGAAPPPLRHEVAAPLAAAIQAGALDADALVAMVDAREIECEEEGIGDRAGLRRPGCAARPAGGPPRQAWRSAPMRKGPKCCARWALPTVSPARCGPCAAHASPGPLPAAARPAGARRAGRPRPSIADPARGRSRGAGCRDGGGGPGRRLPPRGATCRGRRSPPRCPPCSRGATWRGSRAGRMRRARAASATGSRSCGPGCAGGPDPAL